MTKTFIFIMVEKFLSNGQLLKHSITTDTPQQVMCGAMDASSMRYGRWDISHFMILKILK